MGGTVCPERKEAHCYPKKKELMMDRLGEPIVTLSHDISLFVQNNSEELCKQNQAISGIWVGYLTNLGVSCSKD